MLSRLLRSKVRAARRRPGFAALNVVGLALGLACCLLIALYVHGETTYDRFHDRADRIVRVSQEVTAPGREALWAWTGGAMGEDLEADFPSVEAVVRVLRQAGAVRAEADPDRRFREEGFVFAGETFFDVFSHRFVRGDAEAALREPNAVVLTASVVERYFGDADPIGQDLTYEGRLPLTVSGVVANPPPTHLPFDLVAPMAAFKSTQGMPADATFGSDWWPQVWTYLLLPSPEPVATLQAQMADFSAQRRGETDYVPKLEPLTDLHFSAAEIAPSPSGSLPLVQAFAAIALAVLLLLACVNVVNLATAQSEARAREVGVRRAIGASVQSLVGLLTRDFAALVTVAAVLAVPAAWWAARRWLDGFTYRIDIGPLPFVVVALVVLAVVVLTVGGQAYRAATADPVRALRSE